MIPIAQMSLTELVAHVQSHLERAGIRTVLSGGSCVTIWSANAYRSDDIDLIPEGIAQRTRIRAEMLALGFTEERRYFTHAETPLFVEFPAGPLSVGEERPRGCRGGGGDRNRAGVVADRLCEGPVDLVVPSR